MAIPCDVTSLAKGGVCFCGSQDLQEAELTFLLASLAGISADPNAVLAAAKNWLEVDEHFIVAIKAYLTAVLANGSLNPVTLAAASACYCYSRDLERGVWIYLRNAALLNPYTPATLPAAAACFCYSDKIQRAVQAYLLALLAGGSVDPAVISTDASGFLGLPDDALRRIRTYNSCIWLNFVADPVDDWAARVVKNGGAAPSAGTVTAMKAFVTTLKSANLFAKMRAVCCLVPDNLIAAITPLIHRFGNDPWTNHDFVEGTDLSVAGLKPGGGARYLDSGFIPASHFGSASDQGISMIVSLTSGSAGVVDIGCRNTGLGTPESFLRTLSNGLFNNNRLSGVTVSGNSPAFGNYFISGNLTSLLSPNQQVATGNAAHAFAVRGSGANAIFPAQVPTVPYYVFGENDNNGGVINSTDHRMSFVAFHDGLIVADQTALFNAAQALRTALGGGNV